MMHILFLCFIVYHIQDKGFIKWIDAYDKTAYYIKWIALIVNFKVYRMVYSFFMGRK